MHIDFIARVAALMLAGLFSANALAQDFVVRRIATGLSRPVFITAAPGDQERLFVVEQHSGAIKILNRGSGNLNPQPFLLVSGLTTGNEQGLLGLAFHPNYETNGRFFVYYTDTTRATQIVEYQVSANPDFAAPNSATAILSFTQPQSNHNGGWIGFGPDGLLYIASGDGGNSNDSGSGHTPNIGNAQDITNNLLGKILRIDVNGDAYPADPARNYTIPNTNPFVGSNGDDEIWAWGLRNPWRASFDRASGDFYIADVGQGLREEINVQPLASTGGENYGWRLREGTRQTPGVGGPSPAAAIAPVYDYAHGSGTTEGFSVTGGYVYRGPVSTLQGRYFFADYITERIWTLRYDGSSPSTFDGTNYTDFEDFTARLEPDVGSIDGISSFGEDEAGNLYLVDHRDGEVYAILAAPTTSAATVPALPVVALAALGLSLLGFGLRAQRRC